MPERPEEEAKEEDRAGADAGPNVSSYSHDSVPRESLKTSSVTWPFNLGAGFVVGVILCPFLLSCNPRAVRGE
jgi:hypothetical protein